MHFMAELRNRYGDRLTSEQQRHIEGIILRFAERAYAKYARGQREHGGDLWRRPVVQEILDESVDLIIYAYTLDMQVRGSGSWIGMKIPGNGSRSLEAEAACGNSNAATVAK